MKSIVRRFALCWGRWRLVHNDNQPAEVAEPEPVVTVAAVACGACIFLFALLQAHVRGMWRGDFLLGALLATLVAFAILYHSHLRRELAPAARFFALLRRAMLIFCVVFFLMGLAGVAMAMLPGLLRVCMGGR